MSARVLSVLRLALLGIGWLGALSACLGERSASAGADADGMVVRRGTLQERLLVTGELVAARAERITMPKTPSFQLQVRWMEEDGTPVEAGQKVVEFDNSTFTAEMEEKKLRASEAVNELARMEAEGKTAESEKRFAVEERKSALEKARVAAAVPRELLTVREYQERQTALRRAEVELEKAEKDMAAYRQAHAADLEVRRIDIERSRREIQAAERAIQVLTVRAPRAGILLAAEHPWEGRKFQQGDSVWPGMAVATIPDLASLRVEAALPDVDDGRVRPGMRVECYLDAYPSIPFPGKVVEITPVARESRNNSLRRFFTMKVDLDRVDRERMRPGMSVRVEVRGREVRDALLAPRTALDFAANPPRAFLAAGGTAPVRLRLCTAAECAVEGLEEGTRLRPVASESGEGERS